MSGRFEHILVVDDDEAVAVVLVAMLTQGGYRATATPSAEAALRVLADEPVDLVVSDVRMPGMGGLDLLSRVLRDWPEIAVILVTAHASVPLAVEAMRRGASDFVEKPVRKDALLETVSRALRRTEQARARPPMTTDADGSILGSAPAMRATLALAHKAALGTANVLIRGETGTGKGLLARAIHDHGPRRTGPFISVHCAAIPEALIESELFGYEKGAFTGALTRKPGRLELADGGTLFLDEIGDVPLSVQVKLLRVVQERQFERVGGTRAIHVDVRFVAATHRDLETMVARGEFREDLFYRLSVLPLVVPPLRQRTEDVSLLARAFLDRFAKANGRREMGITEDALKRIAAHPLPGNVRQLENLIERLVVFADTETIDVRDVARELGDATAPPPPVAIAPAETHTAEPADLTTARGEAERRAISDALVKAAGNRTLAARLLGISRRSLYNKLSEYSLS